MPASASDKFRKSYSFTTKNLSSNVDASTTTFPLNNTTNVPTDTGVDFIVDRVDSNGVSTSSKRELCRGIVSGSNITNVVRGLHGTTAQTHDAGATVEFVASGAAWNDFIDGILTSLDQDGTLKAGAVDNAAALASDVVTSTKIAQNAVQADDLATNALSLGSASITSNFTLSASQTTPTQVTGLTATVTIPAGGRSIKITAFAASVSQTGGIGVLTIWDGVVNSGTQLAQGNVPTSGGFGMVQAIVTPAAGSKTYNVGVHNTGTNNTTVGATSTQPAFIFVEAI